MALRTWLGQKVSASDPVLVLLADSDTWLELSTLAMVSMAVLPVPPTCMPGSRPAVLDRPVTRAGLLLTVPVSAAVGGVNRSCVVPVVPALAVSVTWLALSTVAMALLMAGEA